MLHLSSVPVADLHTKVSGAPPPPTGPNSFVFTYVFTEKRLCWRLAPPPTRVGAPPPPPPPNGKYWIRPCVQYFRKFYLYLMASALLICLVSGYRGLTFLHLRPITTSVSAFFIATGSLTCLQKYWRKFL